MSSNVRILLTAVSTTFAIISVGFGVDSMLASSPIKHPSGYQPQVSTLQSATVRVILPVSADPAHPPQPSIVALAASEFQRNTGQVKAVAYPGEKNLKTSGNRRTMAAEGRRRHYSERQSAMMAARAKQQMQQIGKRPEPPILAFGGDDPTRGMFGN